MLLSVAFAVFTFSCSNTKKEEKKEDAKVETEQVEEVDNIATKVKYANKLCPNDMGSGLTLTKIDYDGETVEFIVKIDETMYTIEGFRQTGAEAVKAGALSAMTPEVIDADPFLKSIIEAEKIIRYTYVDSADNSFSFDINPEEF